MHVQQLLVSTGSTTSGLAAGTGYETCAATSGLAANVDDEASCAGPQSQGASPGGLRAVPYHTASGLHAVRPATGRRKEEGLCCIVLDVEDQTRKID